MILKVATYHSNLGFFAHHAPGNIATALSDMAIRSLREQLSGLTDWMVDYDPQDEFTKGRC